MQSGGTSFPSDQSPSNFHAPDGPHGPSDTNRTLNKMASFKRQLVALLKRNFLLKTRKKMITIQEFFFPIYFVIILGVIRLAVKPRVEAPVESFTEHSVSSIRTLQPSHLLVSPDSAEVRSIAAELKTSLGTVVQVGYTMFQTWQEAEIFHQNNKSVMNSSLIGVHFTDAQLTQGEYTLRFSGASVPGTAGSLYGSQGLCRESNGLGYCSGNLYIHSGFVQLQTALDSILMKKLTNISTFPPPELLIQMMPKPEWKSNATFLQSFSSIYLVLAYSVFVSFMLIAIVTEKEKNIKDGMKLMGLHTSALWLAWMITYAVVITTVTLIITLLAYLIKLFVQSNMGLFFLLLILYGFSVIMLAFMMTPFFSKAEVAGGLGSLATTLFSLLYLAVSLTRSGHMGDDGPQSTIPGWAQWLMSLISPIGLALGVDQGIYLDIYKGGMKLENVWFGQFPVAGSLIMLAVDCVLYGLLAVYFDNVIPNQFGQKKSPVFFLKPSYWCSKPRTDNEMSSLIASLYSTNHSDPSIVEPINSELSDQNVVRICNIKKTFKKKVKSKKHVNAVDGLSLDIYEGQITAILGHNGAGKTTLLNMLTGLTPPTAGNAFIYNLDVSDPAGQEEIHSMMGVCPQHDILLPELTCQEHLEIFAAIKNIPSDMVERQITSALEDVDLKSQKDMFSSKLSGGQKRKLSLAIALIGNPKILLLDEPTAGLDPYSRRHVWSLLKDRCKGRVILLTTHFMDEADILADRKAFMSKGQLKCVGSSLFLKNRFGLGYHISMVADVGVSSEPVTQLVQTHIPQATLNRVHGQEITYLLPLASMINFPALLEAVEKSIEDGSRGIKAYGVSMTTLEEVFLKIGIEETVDEDSNENCYDNPSNQTFQAMNLAEGNAKDNSYHVTVANPEDELTTVRGNLHREQFVGLCKMRFIHVYRNKASFFFRIVMPIIFIVLGVMMYDLLSSSVVEPPSLQLTPASYLRTPSSLTNPPFVYQNSTSTGWNEFIGAIRGVVTKRLDYTQLLNYRPHHAGVNIYKVNKTAQNIYSRVSTLYNDTAIHSLPITLNLIANTLIAMATPVSTSNITTNTFPWPDINFGSGMMQSFGATLILGLGIAPTPAALGMLIVRERERKIRSQLRLSGVSHSMYWGSLFLTDLGQLFLLGLCSIIIILAFGVKALVIPGAMLAICLMYIMYLPTLLILAYAFSFAFKKFETAQNIMYNAFVLLSLLPFLTVSLLDTNGYHDASRVMHYVCCVIDPVYVPLGVFYLVNKVYFIAATLQGVDTAVPVSEYFTWKSQIPIAYLMAVIHMLWAPLLLRFLDIRSTGGDGRDALCCGKNKNKVKTFNQEICRSDHDQDVDSDVEEEREKVDRLWAAQQSPRDTAASADNQEAPPPVIIAHNLRKVFPGKPTRGPCVKPKPGTGPKVAVCKSSFCVHPGEVFGLLGPNGAGKTTTLNLLTAEEAPSNGSVKIAGHDISSSMSEAYRHLGFCPQHDALWDDLTLREHLDLYLSIRGITSESRKAHINYYLHSLKLQEHADKLSKKLSGGTKRKLSYAMSIMGSPDLLLLDEPSTGLDPKSKRFLWDTISRSIVGSSRGAILTTHYMEEADALCSRVCIMVNGQLVCLGSTQHLKNKHGSGYILEVKLSSPDSMEALHRFVVDLVPDAQRAEHFEERATYKISQDSVRSLAHVFRSMEENKERLHIEDYSFSQSTLEQVFLEFAKRQKEDSAEEDSPDFHNSHDQLTAL